MQTTAVQESLEAMDAASDFEIAALVVSTVGVVASIAGFALAFWQLKRTADASIRTREAMERTERRMALNHLLVLVPQFQVMETDLDRAASNNERNAAVSVLSSCSRLSRELAEFVGSVGGASEEALAAKLLTLSSSAASAKSLIVNNKSRGVNKSTSSVRDQLTDIVGEVSALGATYRRLLVVEAA